MNEWITAVAAGTRQSSDNQSCIMCILFIHKGREILLEIFETR